MGRRDERLRRGDRRIGTGRRIEPRARAGRIGRQRHRHERQRGRLVRPGCAIAAGFLGAARPGSGWVAVSHASPTPAASPTPTPTASPTPTSSPAPTSTATPTPTATPRRQRPRRRRRRRRPRRPTPTPTPTPTPSPTPTPTPSPSIVPIVAARGLADDSLVTIEGVLTVPLAPSSRVEAGSSRTRRPASACTSTQPSSAPGPPGRRSRDRHAVQPVRPARPPDHGGRPGGRAGRRPSDGHLHRDRRRRRDLRGQPGGRIGHRRWRAGHPGRWTRVDHRRRLGAGASGGRSRCPRRSNGDLRDAGRCGRTARPARQLGDRDRRLPGLPHVGGRARIHHANPDARRRRRHRVPRPRRRPPRSRRRLQRQRRSRPRRHAGVTPMPTPSRPRPTATPTPTPGPTASAGPLAPSAPCRSGPAASSPSVS